MNELWNKLIYPYVEWPGLQRASELPPDKGGQNSKLPNWTHPVGLRLLPMAQSPACPPFSHFHFRIPPWQMFVESQKTPDTGDYQQWLSAAWNVWFSFPRCTGCWDVHSGIQEGWMDTIKCQELGDCSSGMNLLLASETQAETLQNPLWMLLTNHRVWNTKNVPLFNIFWMHRDLLRDAESPVRCRTLERIQRQQPPGLPFVEEPRKDFLWILYKKDVLDILFHRSFTWCPELLKNANVRSFNSSSDGSWWMSSWKIILLSFSINVWMGLGAWMSLGWAPSLNTLLFTESQKSQNHKIPESQNYRIPEPQNPRTPKSQNLKITE